MEESFKQMYEDLLGFVEGDAKWWTDAAPSCEDLAKSLDEKQAAEWRLLCAVYRVRAKTHLDLVAKMRSRVNPNVNL